MIFVFKYIGNCLLFELVFINNTYVKVQRIIGCLHTKSLYRFLTRQVKKEFRLAGEARAG